MSEKGSGGRASVARYNAALFALLRLQGYFAAHAGITLPNASSVGLHEAFGFRPIGVSRRNVERTNESHRSRAVARRLRVTRPR